MEQANKLVGKYYKKKENLRVVFVDKLLSLRTKEASTQDASIKAIAQLEEVIEENQQVVDKTEKNMIEIEKIIQEITV